MSQKWMYETLSERLKSTCENFEKYLLSPSEYDYPKALFGIVFDIKKDRDSLEFRVGSKRFLLKGEILLSKQMIYLKTYEQAFSIQAYPNTTLKHVEKLDIVYIHNQGGRFAKKIEEPNSMINDPTLIRDFGTQYAQQLWNVIQSFEEAEAPSLDPLSR